MANQEIADSTGKAEFFKGGVFIVNLSLFEAKNSVFIPGHRFLPFLNPAVKPWEASIYTGKGKLLGKKTVSEQLETLKPLYSLYGEENILFLLIDDRKENSKTILDSSDKTYILNATAYDIKPLLEEEQQEQWQQDRQLSLVFKINDWEKGYYTASVRRTDSKPDEAGDWIDMLEKGFNEAIGKGKKMRIVPEVMSDAFICGGKALLENPIVSLDDFFDLSEISDIADLIAEQKEDPVIEEKKRYIREHTIDLIKKLTSWLETGEDEKLINPEAAVILEKQVLITKKTLIAVLEELNNPFVSEETLNTMIQVITDSSNLVSRIS